MARKRFSDREVEMLLSGEVPENEKLARLAAVLHEIHATHSHVPTEEAISLFASQASRIATETLHDGAAPASPRRIPSVWSSRRFAATAAGFALVLGMSGVAAASDTAAPGHPLYGVDRTLESVGIGAGGATERVAEARVLLDRGQVAAAVAHAAEAVRGNASGGEASKELLDAAGTLDEADGEPEEVRDAVSAMLTEMSVMLESGDVDGAEFGRRVSELARSLHGERGDSTSPTDHQPANQDQGQGPPDEVPAGPPQTPGPGDHGPDEPPGGKGPPGGNGPPGHGGQPAGNGPPAGNGSPGRGGPPHSP